VIPELSGERAAVRVSGAGVPTTTGASAHPRAAVRGMSLPTNARFRQLMPQSCIALRSERRRPQSERTRGRASESRWGNLGQALRQTERFGSETDHQLRPCNAVADPRSLLKNHGKKGVAGSSPAFGNRARDHRAPRGLSHPGRKAGALTARHRAAAYSGSSLAPRWSSEYSRWPVSPITSPTRSDRSPRSPWPGSGPENAYRLVTCTVQKSLTALGRKRRFPVIG
jgi:hypothetical protein